MAILNTMLNATSMVPSFSGTPSDKWREMRGRDLALRARKAIKQVGTRWTVPSASAGQSYVVDVVGGSCTCQDYASRRVKCKHQHATEYVLLWSQTEGPDGAVTQTVVMQQRRTYAQPWREYNAAQCSEKETVQDLLRALCDGIPEQPHTGRGRKPIPLGDAVYGMGMKVYGGMSARRSSSDMREYADGGHLSRAPHFNSILNYFDRPDLTPLLTSLVEESASPFVCVETNLAVDSTGFGTATYRRWYDAKYGKEMKESKWVKAHAMVGTTTNVITSVRVTDGNTNDCPELAPLLTATARRFNVVELSADKAYLSHANLAAIDAAGAAPYIPFKVNSLQGTGPKAWRQMYAMFLYQQDEWAAHYHKRSNVESTFSAIKRKFGGAVRSKNFAAQVNEVLCKCLVHNLSMLAHAMHELGIAPTFASVGGVH